MRPGGSVTNMVDDEDRETPEGSGGTAFGRSAARMAAIQALYQVELGEITPEAVIEEFINHRFDGPLDDLSLEKTDVPLFKRLVLGTSAEADTMDDILSAVLTEGWPVERLDRVLRLVLRCGAYELANCIDIPGRVTIAEYLRIAESFYDGKEPAMVNAVLDALARSLRAEEFEGDPRDTAVVTGG